MVSRAQDAARLAPAAPPIDISDLTEQIEALRVLLRAEGAPEEGAGVVRLVRELDQMGIHLRGEGDTVAEIATLSGELRELAQTYPAEADLSLARVRVRDAWQRRVEDWRHSLPSLDLTTQRIPIDPSR